MNGSEQALLSLQPTDIGGIAEHAQQTARVKCENLRLAASVDEGIRPDAEFREDLGGKLTRPRWSQLTVRGASGRSSEKAGIWMENISPCSFCIWYVPTMIPDGVVSGQPLV